MPKINLAKQWERDHPDDEPCPKDPNLAGVWRRERFLEDTAKRRKHEATLAKYEAAMREKRAAEDDSESGLEN